MHYGTSPRRHKLIGASSHVQGPFPNRAVGVLRMPCAKQLTSNYCQVDIDCSSYACVYSWLTRQRFLNNHTDDCIMHGDCSKSGSRNSSGPGTDRCGDTPTYNGKLNSGSHGAAVAAAVAAQPTSATATVVATTTAAEVTAASTVSAPTAAAVFRFTMTGRQMSVQAKASGLCILVSAPMRE